MNNSRKNSEDFSVLEFDEISDGVHLKGRPIQWDDFEFEEDVFGENNASMHPATSKRSPLSSSKKMRLLAVVIILCLVAVATFIGIEVSSAKSANQTSSAVGTNDGKSSNNDLFFISRFPSISPSIQNKSQATIGPTYLHVPPTKSPIKNTDNPTLIPTNIPTIHPTANFLRESMAPSNISVFPSFSPSMPLDAHSEPSLTPIAGNISEPTHYPSIVPVTTPWNEVMLESFNLARIDSGSPIFCWNEKLIQAAEVHVQDMYENEFLGSTGSDGSSVKERAQAFGYSVKEIGQTVLSGYTAVDDAVNALLTNDNLKVYILYEGYIHLGVARQGKYWVQVLAQSKDDTEGCTLF